MTVCPSCGGDVRPVWTKCRSCGALLIAPPAPVVPVGAAVTGSAPSAEEQFFAPAVFQSPVRIDAPTPFEYAPNPRRAGSGEGPAAGAGKWIALIGMVVFVAAAIAVAMLAIRPNAAARHKTPVLLAPRPATAGLPTSLAVIVRVQAESARRTALQTVVAVGNANLGTLAAAQPNFQWVAGDRPSADAHTVSVAQSAGAVTIAVAASNHDVCAFGQWSPNTTPAYVTMGHEETCAAVDAPSTGWSSEAGGAASDLPDDNG